MMLTISNDTSDGFFVVDNCLGDCVYTVPLSVHCDDLLYSFCRDPVAARDSVCEVNSSMTIWAKRLSVIYREFLPPLMDRDDVVGGHDRRFAKIAALTGKVVPFFHALSPLYQVQRGAVSRPLRLSSFVSGKFLQLVDGEAEPSGSVTNTDSRATDDQSNGDGPVVFISGSEKSVLIRRPRIRAMLWRLVESLCKLIDGSFRSPKFFRHNRARQFAVILLNKLLLIFRPTLCHTLSMPGHEGN